MTKEEAIELIGRMSMAYVPTDQYGDYADPEPYEEAVDMAIDALKAKTDGDVISREKAVNETHKYFVEEIDKTPTEIDEDGDEVYTDMPTVNSLLACNKELSKRINALPTAEPKTGEWVLDPNGMDWNIPAWRCSECGFVAYYIGVEANGLGNNPMNWAGSKFCPQCGARITGYER